MRELQAPAHLDSDDGLTSPDNHVVFELREGETLLMEAIGYGTGSWWHFPFNSRVRMWLTTKRFLWRKESWGWAFPSSQEIRLEDMQVFDGGSTWDDVTDPSLPGLRTLRVKRAGGPLVLFRLKSKDCRELLALYRSMTHRS